MKIEVGKTYRTRGGGEVKIDRIDAGDNSYPFGGMLGGVAEFWSTQGNYLNGHRHRHDLLEEVVADGNGPHIVALVVSGRPAPSDRPHIHPNSEVALAEACRLARKYPGSEFAVYARVGGVKAEVNIVNIP